MVNDTHSNRSLATAVVLEKGGKFFVYECGLAVIASGDSIEGAYQNFNVARHSFFEDVESAGLGQELANRPEPAAGTGSTRIVQRSSGRSVAGELGMYTAKLCILLIIVAGLGAGGAITLMSQAPQGGISMVDVANKAAVVVQDIRQCRRTERTHYAKALARYRESLSR
jgi:hypothetical protein